MSRTFLILATLFFLGFLGLGFWANDQVANIPPVIQAVIETDEEKLKLAIRQGHDVNARGPLGMTALVVAIKQGKLDIVKLLIAHNADINVHVGDMTLVEFADRQKQADIAEYLKGASINRGALKQNQ